MRIPAASVLSVRRAIVSILRSRTVYPLFVPNLAITIVAVTRPISMGRWSKATRMLLLPSQVNAVVSSCPAFIVWMSMMPVPSARFTAKLRVLALCKRTSAVVN